MSIGEKQKVFIYEVAPRDGLQNEPKFVETKDKVVLLNMLSESGFKKIETTSFTSPRAIPALGDADELMQSIKRNPKVTYSALVPNLRGLQRAVSANVEEANFVLSCSETHNRVNLRMSREDSLAQLKDVVEVGRENQININTSLSTAFGCPMEGEVRLSEVIGVVERLTSLGVDSITLCDTTGMAYPDQVSKTCSQLKKLYPSVSFTLHLHNTRGLALANALAALNVGINQFDSSLGGLGGCPYAPGASGNVCTEDLVHMLELMGYDTGIDLTHLLKVASYMEKLVGRKLPSYVLKAGPRSTIHPVPHSV